MANPVKFGAFGDIPFEIQGINPRNFRERFSRMKPRHRIVNGYPFIEDTGENERVIELTIAIAYPFSQDPEATYKKLKRLMDNVQPQLLVIGQEILGEFTIEEMEKVPEFAPDGSLRKLTVNLKLVEVRNDSILR